MRSGRTQRSGRNMTCRQVMSMIPDYISDQLNEHDLECFLSHIRNCPACYDELETYFMVDRTVKYLNQEEDGSFNLKPLLEKDLEDKEKRIRRKRKIYKLQGILLIITLAVIVIMVLEILQISDIGEVLGDLFNGAGR